MKNLKLVVLENIKELGLEVNEHLKNITNKDINYITRLERDRFSNGEGKVFFPDSIREQDIYILSDVGNYGITYKMHGIDIPMSPDEHFQDIKRCISAISGHAKKTTVITPLLYQSRQDKRKGRESLDCAQGLQELENLGVNQIITFDCHNPNVANAIPNLPFDNFYPTDIILENFINNEDISNLQIISPDIGAMERARFYAESLNTDVGLFYKRRDISKVINGKNPIVEHVYMGAPVKDKTVIVVDDMIASGGSMIEVGELLKKKGAKKVYFIATFSLFTEGIGAFDKAYEEGVFEKLYTTNLTYLPDEIKNKKWIERVNCSERIADIIYYLHQGKSLKPFVTGKEKILELVNKRR